MKRNWTIHYAVVQRNDAQRRWDLAYQRLLNLCAPPATPSAARLNVSFSPGPAAGSDLPPASG